MDSCALKWLPNIVKGEMQLGLGKYRVVKELVAQSCPAFSPHHPLHHTAAPGPPPTAQGLLSMEFSRQEY